MRPEDFSATNLYTRTYNYDKLGNIQSLRHTTDTLPSNNFTRVYNYQSGFTTNKLDNFQIVANTYSFLYASPERSRGDANGNQTKENTDRYYEWNYGDKLAFFKRQAAVASPPPDLAVVRAGTIVWSHYSGACFEPARRTLSGARTLNNYDTLSRPTVLYAHDKRVKPLSDGW